jgi:ABC-type lipoprotein release transport system permease subunit
VAAHRLGDLGGGPAGRQWARSELRRRWRALVVLGLLAGLTCGLAAAAVAGARRSDAAWGRLRSESGASDAVIFATQAGIRDPDWGPVNALPYVEASGAFSFGNLAEGDLVINQAGDLFTTVDRPRIIEGRLPRPDAPLEVFLERRSASTDATTPRFHVGQRLEVHPLNQEQEAAGPTGKPPTGPTVTLHVVGMAESPFAMAAIPSTAGGLFAGPAFRKAFPDSVQAGFSNLMVRLHDPADVRKLEADVARLFPGKGVPVFDLGNAAKRVTNGTGLEATGLLLFALAIAAAGMVIVGQALTRSVRAASGDLPALSAMGFDRAGAAGALALPHLVSAVTAVVAGIGLAIALSPRFPIGLGRRVDPDVGLHADLPVVLGGGLLVGLLLTTAVLISAWRASARAHAVGQDRPSALVSRARRLGLPVTVVTGAGFALEPGRGRRSLPTRSALSGAAVGVLGLVGALMFLRGLDDAAAHPERFGAVWGVQADFYGDDPDQDWYSAPATIAKDPDVVQVAKVGRTQAPLGDIVVPFYAVTPTSGPPMHFATLEGRGPRRSGELALGPDTARVLHAHIGDSIAAGDGHHFRVVGLGLFPTTPHSSFDQGAWILPQDVTAAVPMKVRSTLSDAFGADLTDDATFKIAFDMRGFVAAAVRPGADLAAVTQRLQKAVGPDIGIALPSASADQASMRNVRSLPILFGVFAPLVALAGLLHVSSSVLRRRGGDLAVLRAIGLTPRQAGSCVAWQTTLLATIGLVVGAPAGYIVGRATWLVVAEHTPMLAVVPTLTVPILLIAPAVLLAANLAGARPAWRVSHASAVEQLRAD